MKTKDLIRLLSLQDPESEAIVFTDSNICDITDIFADGLETGVKLARIHVKRCLIEDVLLRT